MPQTVLLNVFDLQDNPFPQLWREAWAEVIPSIQAFNLSGLVGARRRGPGIVNLQWPEWCLLGVSSFGAFRGVARILALSLIARLLGFQVWLTIHNERGHALAHQRLERVMWIILGRLATHIHTFTEAGGRKFEERVPGSRRARRVVIPHGHYGPVVPAIPTQRQARAELGIHDEALVFLQFGKLSRYKGLGDLVNAFAPLATSAPYQMWICGTSGDEETTDYINDLTYDPRITVRNYFLSSEELCAVMAAANLVVLPYSRVTNSGSALMALTAARKVLLPRTEIFEELAGRCGEWIQLFDGRLTAEVLRNAVEDLPDGMPDLDWCSWEAVQDQLRQEAFQ